MAEPRAYIVAESGETEAAPTYSTPIALYGVGAAVTQAPAQADSEATTIAALVTDFNALLAKLRTAGVLAA